MPREDDLEDDLDHPLLACLYQEGDITGIIFCHETGGPKTRWAYNREGLQPGFYTPTV